MLSLTYSEFIGISPRTSSLIEAYRINADETKDEILLRALSTHDKFEGAPTKSPLPKNDAILNIGEGAELIVGEKIYLFLSKKALKQNKPDGIALVGNDGLYIDDNLINKSKGSYIQPAMVHFQLKKNHRNESGETISLSAWRQWHALRDNKWVSLLDLKDPAKAYKRGGKVDVSHMSIDEILAIIDT